MASSLGDVGGMFGGGGSGGGRAGAGRGEDMQVRRAPHGVPGFIALLQVSLQLSFMEAVHGCVKDVSFRAKAPCDVCKVGRTLALRGSTGGVSRACDRGADRRTGRAGSRLVRGVRALER